MGNADTIQVLGAFFGVLGAAAQQSAPLCTLLSAVSALLPKDWLEENSYAKAEKELQQRRTTAAT